MSKHKRGMKPWNAPGRKNDRRKRALKNLKPGSEAYLNTVAKIVPDSVALGTRNKKDRSAQAKLRT